MGWFSDAASWVGNAASSVGSAVVETASYTVSAATEVVDATVNNTVGLIPGVPELNSAKLIDDGMDLVGVETEFEERADAIVDVATNVGEAIWDEPEQRTDEDGNLLYVAEDGSFTTEATDAEGNAREAAMDSGGFVNGTALPWMGTASQYVVGMGAEVTDGVLNNTVGLVVDHEFNTSAELDSAFAAMGVETSFEERGETGWRETGNYAEFWYDDPARAAALLGQGLTDSVTSTVGMVGDIVYGAGHAAVAGVANLGLEGEDRWSYVVRDEEGNANFFRMSNGLKDMTQWADEPQQFIDFPVDDPDHFIFDANSDTFNPESEYYDADAASLYELNSETNRYELRADVDPSLIELLRAAEIRNPNIKYERTTVAVGQAVGEVGAFIAVSIPTGGAGGAALAAARGTAATAKNTVTALRAGNFALRGVTTTTVRTADSVGGAIRAGQATNRVTRAIRTASSGVDEAADAARVADRALDTAKAADEGVDAAQAIATTSREALETATSGLDDALNGARRLDRRLDGRQFMVAGQRGVQQADLEQHLARYAEKLAQRTAKVDDLLEQGVTGSRLERARNAVDKAENALRREVSEVNAVARRAGLESTTFDDAAKLTIDRVEMGLGQRIMNGAGIGMHRTGNFIIPNSRLEWALEGGIAAATTGFLTNQKLEEDAAELEQLESIQGSVGGTDEASLTGPFGEQAGTNGSVTAAGADVDGAGQTSTEFSNRSNGLVTPSDGSPVFTITVSPEAAQELEGALER